MTQRNRVSPDLPALLLVAFATSALATAAPSGNTNDPDLFGLQTIYHWIPAAAFNPERSDTSYITDTTTEYLYRTDIGAFNGWFVAPLGLEDGSFLQGIRLFFYDNFAQDISWGLCKYHSHPDGTNPGAVCPYAGGSAGTPGYSSELVMVNETVRLYDDVDGDGTKDDVRWIVLVSLPSATDELQFAGVRAFWRRQVSPAPQTATFNDVPTSDAAFAFVEALSASGITAGCGGFPPLYCPDAPLTRRQMAVFLAKALGLHWTHLYP
jgi:hypothetical protein